MLCLGDPGVVEIPVVPVEIPDELDKLRIKPLGAVSAHVRPGFAVIGKHPLGHARQTLPFGIVQINDGVTMPQAQRHGAAEITVDDPSFPFQHFFQPGIEFLPADVLSSVRPPELVQMDHGQIQFFTQKPCQLGLSAAGTANDKDSFHSILLHAVHP